MVPKFNPVIWISIWLPATQGEGLTEMPEGVWSPVTLKVWEFVDSPFSIKTKIMYRPIGVPGFMGTSISLSLATMKLVPNETHATLGVPLGAKPLP